MCHKKCLSTQNNEITIDLFKKTMCWIFKKVEYNLILIIIGFNAAMCPIYET